MKAVCPNDPKHKRFYTGVHMSETWIVDPEGNWLETADDPGETVAGPHPDNTWQCQICGADAEVTDA